MIGSMVTDGTVVWTVRTEAFIAEGYINDLNINLTNGIIRQNICKYMPATANRPSFVGTDISYGNVITIGLKDNGFSQLAIGQFPVNTPPIAVRNFDKSWGDWNQVDSIVSKFLNLNGYIKYASKLILQWGYATSGTTKTITFNIVFTHVPIIISNLDSLEITDSQVISGQSSTANFLINRNTNVKGGYWFAIGY